jgi:hypothetical protein
MSSMENLVGREALDAGLETDEIVGSGDASIEATFGRRLFCGCVCRNEHGAPWLSHFLHMGFCSSHC